MLREDDVLPRGTESPFLSALHAKNNTTNLFGYKLGESTENKKALLFFSGKETIQTFSGCIEVIIVCEVISHVWKFYKDLFLNCRVSSWPDLSIKSYFLMVSSPILLRSLRVYFLKQLFFSISVNSGLLSVQHVYCKVVVYVRWFQRCLWRTV